jgi:hypothetical protein
MEYPTFEMAKIHSSQILKIKMDAIFRFNKIVSLGMLLALDEMKWVEKKTFYRF